MFPQHDEPNEQPAPDPEALDEKAADEVYAAPEPEPEPAPDPEPAPEPAPAPDPEPEPEVAEEKPDIEGAGWQVTQSELAAAGDYTAADPDDAPGADERADSPAADGGDVHDDHHDADADAAVTAPAEPTTVAELIAATLRTAGVRIAFTVPGESFLPVLDAFAAAGIRIVATRHEGAAAFAAEAYGQLTGRPAACLGTRAVGASNLAIGIHTATADSTPMFVLVGDVARGLKGREAFQEVDLVSTLGGLAKWAGVISDPETAATTLEMAVRATVEGRPGPAFLALPEDVLDLPIPDGTRAPVVRQHPETPSASDIRAVLHFLAGAERPVIVAGAGVLRARCSNDLVRFAELLHVPVVASWRRGDVIPNEHPLYLGMTGFGSPRVVRERIENADALLVIGSRLSEPTSFEYCIPAMGQRWMHVDLEPRSGPVGFASSPERAIRADARAFLRAAVARLKGAVLLAEPLAARDRNNSADRAAWEAATVVDDGAWSGPGVHPGKIVWA